jgi:hypothetical protein
METQDLINFGFVLVSGVLGWFAREMWSAVKELKADLAKLREELPTKYVTKDDFKHDMQRVLDMLDKIWTKLDGKADK